MSRCPGSFRRIMLGSALACFALPFATHAQVSTWQNERFWRTASPHAITWDVRRETRLPHSDNIEMSGRRVAGIISYEVDTSRYVHISRDIIFPQLVTFIGSHESSWRRYRAYLRSSYDDDILPVIIVGGFGFRPGPLDSVRIDGMLSFYHAAQQGLRVTRTFVPSMAERAFAEIWSIRNVADSSTTVHIGSVDRKDTQQGRKGTYRRRIRSDADEEVRLEPSGSYSFGIYVTAAMNDESDPTAGWDEILAQRAFFMSVMRSNLVLETPDPVINTLFLFSKVRAAESIYETPMGLVHSPGGGRYYAGVWANDQGEYSGPFFPYLGYIAGNQAALNAYRQFARNIPEGDGHFWSSYEMNGELTCCGADRGDAAMLAYGASQFALTNGDRTIAEELWPLIEWSIEYCERRKNDDGVITSDTDEMEGRIPTGKANLSTSSLTYGALLLAADLADVLGKSAETSDLYRSRAQALAGAIESYFGATLEGLETYRYYKGHTFLRHWICLPLVMGIEDRKNGTLEALFSKLWTPNGVRVEHNPALDEPDLFWDRGTLYAFRGAFKAGAVDRALDRLRSYSETRLLGFHVPYVVEAWPEGNMAHLSAESALYCRIFPEGLLGITPREFSAFDMIAQLPASWPFVRLLNVRAFGHKFDIIVERDGTLISVTIRSGPNVILHRSVEPGTTLRIRLP